MRMMLLTAGLAIAITDAVAVRMLKDVVGRPRPHEVLEGVHTLDLALARPRFLALAMPLKEEYSVARIRPPRGNSFPSAHAANNFAVAAVCAAFLPKMGVVAFRARDAGCLQPGLCGLALAAGCVRFVLARCGRRPLGGSRCRGIMAPLGGTLHSGCCTRNIRVCWLRETIRRRSSCLRLWRRRRASPWYGSRTRLRRRRTISFARKDPAPAYFDGPGGTAVVTEFASSRRIRTLSGG